MKRLKKLTVWLSVAAMLIVALSVGMVSLFDKEEGLATPGYVAPAQQYTEAPSGYTAISSEADFEKMRSNLGGKYMLMNDIKLSNSLSQYESKSFFRPIGSSLILAKDTTPSYVEAMPFFGTFDGNDYTITYDMRPGGVGRNWGLFAVLGSSGIVRNLKVNATNYLEDGIRYFDPNHATNLTIKTGAIAGINNGYIYNCEVNMTISLACTSYSVPAFSGGIVGQNTYTSGSNSAKIENCTFNLVQSSDKTIKVEKIFYFGGMAGRNQGGRIESCVSNMSFGNSPLNITHLNTVTSQDLNQAIGGLVGYTEASSSGGIGKFKNNIVDINIRFETSNINNKRLVSVGGAAGYADKIDIESTRVTGDIYVSESGAATGLVHDNTVDAGGLIGYSVASAAVNKCEAAVNVTALTSESRFKADTTAGGLIGYMEGTGTVSGSSASGKIYAKAAGQNGHVFAGGLIGRSTATVSNCTAKGEVFGEASSSNNSFYQRLAVGGLLGDTYKSVSDSVANVSVKGYGHESGTMLSVYMGGLVGIISSGTITRSHATGNVDAYNTDSSKTDSRAAYNLYAGGLVGRIPTKSSGISDSTAIGSVKGSAKYIMRLGGIVGESGSYIRNCTASGSVWGYTTDKSLPETGEPTTGNNLRSVGGIVGRAYACEITNATYDGANVFIDAKHSEASGNANAGGIAGTAEYDDANVNITSCAAFGTVTARAYYYARAGGLVGYSNSSGAIQKSFFNGTTVSGTYSDPSSTLTSLSAGLVAYASATKISECMSEGIATVEYVGGANAHRYISGLVAHLRFSGSITNSYSITKLNTNEIRVNYIGGLVGCIQDSGSLVNNSYFAGTSDKSDTNGICGENLGGDITNSYIKAGSNLVSTKGGTILSEGMITAVQGFDFERVWTDSGSFEGNWPALRAITDTRSSNKTDSFEVMSFGADDEIYRFEDNIKGSQGNFGIDKFGIVYRLSQTDKTASVMGLSLSKYDDASEEWNLGDGASLTVTLRNKVYLTSENSTVTYTVTSIEEKAFERIIFLSNINISDSILTIGKEAFKDCIGFERFALGGGVLKIESGAFDNCTSLQSFNLNTALTHIEAKAFYNCTKLKGITFGVSLKSIGDSAFEKCFALRSANFLGDRPESIGSNVFFGVPSQFIINYSTAAKNWETVNAYNNGRQGIPSGWKINYAAQNGDIHVYAYGMVRMLSKVDGQIDVYEDDLGLIYKITASSGDITDVTVGTGGSNGNAIKSGVSFTTVSIPQRVMVDGFTGEHDVTKVAQNAFNGIQTIAVLSFQKNINSIGTAAFANCPNLNEIYFYGNRPSGSGLFTSGAKVNVVCLLGTTGWGSTFDGMSLYSAAELTNMRDTQGILYTVFDNEDSYTATVGTASGGENRTNSASYYGASGAVIIPEYIFTGSMMYKVTELDRYAFFNNRYIKTLELGRNIETVGDMSLRNTENLTEITVHKDNAYYGAAQGILCSKVTITLDNQSDYPYTHDTDYAVGSVLYERIIKVPERIVVSGGWLKLYDESNDSNNNQEIFDSYPLNHVVIIDNYAFAGNKTINKITAGRIGVIGDSAFENCIISEIEFVQKSGPANNLKRIGKNAFFNCVNLTAFNITENVYEIGDGAFALCSGITNFSVSLGNNYFESHGENADQGGGVLFRIIRNDVAGASEKIGLELMQYPAGYSGRNYYSIPAEELQVISVKAQAFASAKYLTEIVIGDTVTEIASGAFSDCINLRYVHIGASVDKLGAYVFDRCFNLTEIYVDETNKFFIAKDGVLYNYEQTLLIAYTAGSQRISFSIPDTVVEIEPFAFAEARALLRVIVPATVVTVGESAFYNANRLQSVYFKGDIPTDMGKYLFDGVSQDFVVYRREFAEGWTMSFAGFPVKIYNSIAEIGNDVASESMYILAIVDSYGAPHSGFKVVFNGESGDTDANGFVTFSFDPESADTVSIAVSDPENVFYPYSNSAFILDKNIRMSYITMIDRSWVMGVSVSGSSASAKDINSQVAKINVSPDYKPDGKQAYQKINITVEGYVASVNYIKEYALIQNGEKIVSDKGPGGDGFIKGKYTFENIDYTRFKVNVPVQVLMLVGKINSVDKSTVEEILIDLNINIFRLDNPIMPQLSPGSSVSTDSNVPFIGGLDFDFSMGSINASFAMDSEEVRIGLGIEVNNKDNQRELMDAVKELMDEWKGTKSAPVDSGPVDVEVEFKIAGYMILSYSPNGLQFRAVEIHGYCAITISYEHSLTEQIGIPITIEVELEIESEIKLRIAYDEKGGDKAGMYFEDLVASLDVKLTVRAGLGCMVFSVGIYGRLGAFIKVQFIPKVQLLKLSVFGELGLYMKVGIGPFKITKEFSLLNATYIWVSDDPNDQLGFSWSSPFMVNQLMSAMTVQDIYSISASGDMTLSEIEARGIKMFEFDDKRIMVYYDDVYANANGYYNNTVGNYDEYNFLKLVYSVYDETTDKWGIPVIFDDNGKNDGEYNLTSTAEGVYLAYTQATKTITVQTDIDEYLASLEVKTSLFATAGFGNKLSVNANNNMVDINPKVSKLADGTVYVAWFSNSDNNMFGLNSSLSDILEGTVETQETTANSLWYSKLSGGVWGESILVKDGLHTMIDYEMSGGIIYYILDEDCDLETTDDKSIYTASLNGETITNALVLGNDKKNAYADISYFGGQFVYALNGNLYTIDGTKLFENDIADFSGNYSVASEGNTVRAVVYAGTVEYPATTADGEDDYGMGLYALYFDGTTYGLPILLKDFGANSYIDKFETYYNANGLNVACIITYNGGDNVLFEGSFKPQGISVSGFSVPSDQIVYYDNGAVAGAMAKMTITNNGYTALSSVKAEIFDKEGYTVYNNDNITFTAIASGKSAQISFEFEVSDLNSGVYKMCISFGENQSYFEFVLLYTDLQISSKHVVIGGINYLLVSVYNASPFTTSATLYALGSYEENILDNIAPETKAIYNLEIGSMKSGERKFFMVELDELFYKSDAAVMGGALTMYVKSSVTDGKAYNNYSTVSVNEIVNTGGSDEAIIKNPFVYIVSDRFSKTTSDDNYKDMVIEITLNGNEFMGIDGLTKDTEYTVDDGVDGMIILTISKDYLETLNDARHSFTLLFDETATRSFSILVYGENAEIYTVSWNVNGVVTKESYEKNEIPQYTGVIRKAPDDSFTYEFSHWEDEDGNRMEPFPKVTGDTTYYAAFTQTAVYTVSFVDELTGIEYDISAIQGDDYSDYLTDGFDVEGYVFSHWSKTKNGVAVFPNDEITQSHTLYAVYALIPFVTLNQSDDIDKIYDGMGNISVNPQHTAAGATYSYKWYKYNGTEYIEIEGETSATLNTANVSDSGSYKSAVTVQANGLTKTEEAIFTVSIARAPLTITADEKSMVYGGSEPALTYRLTSGRLFGNDALIGELSRTAGNTVNTYTILQGTLTAGGNYNITYVDASFIISKAPNHAPTPADITIEKTANGITVSGSGLEYSINGGAWQSSGVFIGLLANTPYTVSVRFAETENYLASEVYSFVITTDKGAQSKVDKVSVKQVGVDFVILTEITGAEYSMDGTTWQDSNVFTGLNAKTQYNFHARYKETGTQLSGSISDAIQISTKKAGLSTAATVVITVAIIVVILIGIFFVIWFGIKKKSFSDLFKK